MTSSVKARHRADVRPITPLTNAPRMARRGLAVAASSGLALTMITSGASAAGENTQSLESSAGTLQVGPVAGAEQAVAQNAEITVAADVETGSDVAVAAAITTEQPAPAQAEQATTDTAADTMTSTTTTSAAGGSAVAASASGIAATAMQYVGAPYVWGAGGPSAFDCSGLVSYVYALHGISVPHSSSGIAATGTQVSTPQSGDVLYWPGHVAIYAGDGMMVSANSSGVGVVYEAVDPGATYYRF